MFKYLKKYWFFALLAPLCMAGEAIMDLIQPKMMSVIVDQGVLGLDHGGVGDLSLVLTAGLKMIGFVVIGGLCGVLCGVFTNMCCQNFGNDIRKNVFRRVMALSFQQTDQFSTGSLVTRITNDITQIQNMVSMCIRGLIRNIVMLIGGVIFMLTLDLSFGAVALCALPFLVICSVYFIGRVTPLFSVLQKKLDKVNSVMQENVTGARVVKAYVQERYERKRFGGSNDDLVDTQLKIMLTFSYMTPIMNIILNAAVVAVIYVGSIKVNGGGITPGNIMAAITYLSNILHGVMMFAMVFQNISRGMASWKRLREVLDCEPAVSDRRSEEEASDRGGEIIFDHVSFFYPGSSGEKVLSDINLTISPGETLGIMGATGSGKSSLVNLIPRFYDVSEGNLYIDGKNVKDYKLKKLRNKIAIVLQKSELFSMTIQENLKWGNMDACKADLEKAAKEAQAAEFIRSKPEGFDTMVAEKGMSLSGGQKQRLSITRALLKQAEILILDDSTSALDMLTESRLYEALNREYPNMTKIIIAQRISSVQGADRIAVIDGGTIAACDSHENLLKGCEIYQDIYRSQLKAEGGAVNAG